MTDTTAKIRAKGLSSTGVTEDLARKMYENGGHYVAIVDLKVARTIEDVDDGDQTVELIIDQIEPVVDGGLNGALVDHVREIQRALYRNRKLAEGGDTPLPVDGDGEPTVEQVRAAGAAFFEHNDDGDPSLWDGDTDTDEDAEPEQDDEQPAPDDPTYETHTFKPEYDGFDALCTDCQQPAGAAVHAGSPDEPEAA